MKKIINGKTYNTDTAIKLFSKGTGKTAGFYDWEEEYYVTKKGNFFKYYWGGAKTIYAEESDNGRSFNEGSGIKELEDMDVLEELDDSCRNINYKELQKYFEIEEA